MNAPKYIPTWNVTTILGAANLALLLIGGGMAYSTLRAEILALREADIRLEAADVQIRIDAQSSETRLRIVEQGATRMETKLEAIVAGIDRLSAQIDRLIDGQP